VLEGKKQKEIAQTFGVTPQTICGWVKAYRLRGQGALKSQRKGRPKGGKLLPWQAAQICPSLKNALKKINTTDLFYDYLIKMKRGIAV